MKSSSSSSAMRNLLTDQPQASIPDDILIRILTRLDFRDIVRYRCVCKRWKNLTSDQQFLSSIAAPQSLFVVVSRCGYAPYPTSIVRLEPPVPNHEHTSPPVVQVIQTNFSAHIPDLPHFEEWDICWGISSPPASSNENLYMLPDWVSGQRGHVGSFPGFIFNLSTRKCKIIKPPMAPKYLGYVATMGNHIYFMTQPGNTSPDPRFERYDTLSESWEELTPLPLVNYDQPPFDRFNYGINIRGTAVLDDTILFNMDNRTIRAYNVGKNKWYTVKVLHYMCYNIVGEAVVLNKSIYALGSRSVATLSLKCQETHDDLVFTCDLNKEYAVQDLLEIEYVHWDSFWWDCRLVHLGKDNFCLVESCCRRGVVENQYIRITYMEVSEKKSIVTNICLHEFKLPDGDLLGIEHCFSMPNCKATALKEGTRFNPEDEAEIVTLPLEMLMQSHDKYSSRKKIIAELDFEQGRSVSQSSQSRDHAADTTPEIQEDVPKKSSPSVVAAKSNVPSKPSTISAVTGHKSLIYAKSSSATKVSTLGDGDASGRSNNTDEEGHSICVRNLPLDFNLRQFEKVLKKFGPIKSFGIHTDYSHMSECRFADVEFESATSKQNAIKASLITIGGRIAVIDKKRGTGLTQGDYNRTSSSSSSGSTNVKNHGEDSRSKSASGGHNARKKSRSQCRSKGAKKIVGPHSVGSRR